MDLNKKIGNITYYDSSGQSEYNFDKPYSEKTAVTIDEEIHEIIEEQYRRAVKLLGENKDKLTELAEYLLDKEVIFKENLEKIFGKREWEDTLIIEDLADEEDVGESVSEVKNEKVDAEKKETELSDKSEVSEENDDDKKESIEASKED
jgi:hypothetical protein